MSVFFDEQLSRCWKAILVISDYLTNLGTNPFFLIGILFLN